MAKKRIKKCGEKEIEFYDTLRDAAMSVDSNMDEWKKQMLINDALNKKGKAFKCRWDYKEED